MRFTVILMAAMLVCLPCFADPYLLFREKDKIGIKDDAGRILIPATFDALGWSDGSFSVVSGVTGYKLNDHWGLINLKKELLSGAEYERMTWPGGDRIVVRKKINAVKSLTGCIDLKGKVAVPFRYDGITINRLRAIVFLQQPAGFRYGLIDLNGRELLPPHFTSIVPVGARFAVENEARKTALYDESGNTVIGFSIDSIGGFHDGYALFYQNLREGLITTEGDVVAPAEYEAIRVNADRSVDVRLPDVWNVLNGENKILRQVQANQLRPMDGKMYHVTRGHLHGIVDAEFKPVLPLEYDYLGPHQEHQIIAGKNHKRGLIRLNGSIVLPIEFDSVICEGRLVRVRRDIPGKQVWSLYDTFAIRKTEKDFDFIGPFNGTFFPARKNTFWGGIDRYGKETIQCVYDSILSVSGDQVAVRFMGQYGIISSDEKWLVPPQSLRAAPVHGDCYWVRTDSTFFLRNLSGGDIYFTKNSITLGPEYMTERSVDGSEKLIDYQGRILERSAPVLVEKTEKIFPSSEGLRGIQKDGKFGFVDERGRLRIANRYDGIGPFRERLAAVKIITRWGYINHSEQIVVQPVYDHAGDFLQGRALVGKQGKSGVIDTEGKLILAVRYDSIIVLPDRYFLLYTGSLCGLADPAGQLLVDTRFDEVKNLTNGYCLIRRDGKSGLLTLQGMSTIPLQYDQLIYDSGRNEYLGLIKSSWRKIR